MDVLLVRWVVERQRYWVELLYAPVPALRMDRVPQCHLKSKVVCRYMAQFLCRSWTVVRSYAEVYNAYPAMLRPMVPSDLCVDDIRPSEECMSVLRKDLTVVLSDVALSPSIYLAAYSADVRKNGHRMLPRRMNGRRTCSVDARRTCSGHGIHLLHRMDVHRHHPTDARLHRPRRLSHTPDQAPA